MATVAQHIYHLKEILSKGLPSDDFRLTNRHLYFILIYVRAELLKNKLEKGKKISPFNYQSIPCYKLEYKAITDCGCYTSTCKALQGVEDLPAIISNPNTTSGLALQGIWNINLHEKYSHTSIDKLRHVQYTKTKKNGKTFFIHPTTTGHTLHVQDQPSLEVVSVVALFEDPIAISKLKLENCSTETGTACYDPLKDEFPMSLDMVRVMYKMSYEELTGIMMKVPNDTTNNSQDINQNGK